MKIEFDGSSLENLSRHLHESADLFRVETTKTLAEVGEELKTAAIEIVKPHSKTVAAAIRFDMEPGAAVIHAPGPLPVAYELGNKKSATSNKYRRIGLAGPVTHAQALAGQKTRTAFVHPVFGNMDVRVVQEGFPFLRPALAANRRAITKRMKTAWEKSLEPVTRRR